MTISLRNKLLVVSTAPLVLALALGGLLFVQSNKDRSRMVDARHRLASLEAVSNLLGAVQGERGIAYLYVSGAAAADRLMTTRHATDDAWEKARARFAENPVDAVNAMEVAAAIMQAVPPLRRQVDERAIMGRGVYTEYSGLTDRFMKLVSELSRSDAAEASRLLGNMLLYEKAKESAGRIQCLASTFLNQDAWSKFRTVKEILEANAAVTVNLAAGEAILDDAMKTYHYEMTTSPDYVAMQDGVLAILTGESTDSRSYDGLLFYDTTYNVITLMQRVIDALAEKNDVWLADRVAQLSTTMLYLGVITILSSLLVTVVSALMLTDVSRRLDAVSAGMKDIASGEADLTRKLPVRGRDELAALSCHFNDFVSLLQGLLGKVKIEVSGLRDGMLRLSANTEETSSAIHQITSNIEGLRLQTAHQAHSVSESNVTVEEIARSVHQLYSLVEQQADSVATSSCSIEEMVASIRTVTGNIERMGQYYNDLLGKSDAGRGAIGTVVTQVREIDNQSERLQEANSLIAGIAAQTNLLAMNAAIEAAHAGEAGRGFAVVADEIRKLAENSASQSKTITHNIKGIRKVIDDVVASSGLSASTFDEIVDQIRVLSRLEEEIKFAMQEQTSGSTQILSSLGTINEVTGTVRSAAGTMLEGANKVMGEMNRLAQLATELENGMTEMVAGAEEIRRAAHDTREMSSVSADSVEAVSSEIEKFRT